ncbi:Hypothetical predicted protein, partial [Scomber scombrus]
LRNSLQSVVFRDGGLSLKLHQTRCLTPRRFLASPPFDVRDQPNFTACLNRVDWTLSA